MITVDLLLVV